MASRLAALPCALCVLVLPAPSVNPTGRSEGFVSASAQQDQMMKTLAPAVPPVLVAEARCRAVRSVRLPLRLDLHSLSREPMPFPIALNMLLCAIPNRRSHCSQALHQALPRPWSVLRPAVPRKSSHLLQLTDHESLFRWHAVQRSCFLDSMLRENDVFVCHWRLANPDSMAPSLIQIACRHGRVLVHHSFSEWQHLARVRFPKKRAQTQFSRRFSL